jgi:hypothetical protein
MGGPQAAEPIPYPSSDPEFAAAKITILWIGKMEIIVRG